MPKEKTTKRPLRVHKIREWFARPYYKIDHTTDPVLMMCQAAMDEAYDKGHNDGLAEAFELWRRQDSKGQDWRAVAQKQIEAHKIKAEDTSL